MANDRANGDWKRATLIALGGGGFGLAITLGLVVRSDPRAVLELLRQWGGMFVIAAACLWMLDRRFGEFIGSNREVASAQRQMADAVQSIAHKSDRDSEEQRRLLSYVGSQMEKILERQEASGESMRKKLGEIESGLVRIGGERRQAAPGAGQ